MNDIPDGFKMTELGVLPEGWDVVRLGDVSIVKTSFPSFNSIQKIDSQNNDDEMVLALKVSDMNHHVNQKYIIESQIAFRHPKNDLKKNRFLQPDSIIFPKRGGAIGTNKKRITKYYSILDPNLIGVEPSKKVDKEYLFCFFEQFDLRSLQDNTPIPQLNKNHVVSILLPFPPFPEQQKIATVLSTVQQAKEKTDAVISATKELKKSLMKHLFTYGPVPVKKFNELRVDVLQNSINSINSINLKETEIGLVPEEWDVKGLGEVIRGTQYGISLRGNQEGQYPILRMKNLMVGHVDTSDLQYVDLDEDIFKKFLLNKGDILFNRTNSFELVGKTALFDLEDDFVFASYLIRVVSENSKLVPEYLNYYLNWGTTQNRLKMLASRGVSQSNINATKLRGFSIPCPPHPTQQKIASILSAVDEKIEKEEAKKKSLDELFKSLLHNLMTGKVRVNHIEVML